MSSDRARPVAFLKALVAVVVWGASFIATKVALGAISPPTLIFLRFAMGIPIIAATAALRGELQWVRGRELAQFVLLGFIGVTLHQWLQATGLKTAQASTTAWIVASIPVFMAILGWAVLGEAIGGRRAVGIAIAALGVMLGVGKGDLPALFGGRAAVVGDYLVLLSAPNWAVFSVLSRRGLRAHPAARMMFYVMTSGWVLSIPLLAGGAGLGEITRLTSPTLAAVLFLGIVCSGIAYVFWYDALKTLQAAKVGALIYIEPVVAVIVAAIVLGEPILPIVLAGGGLILFGVWLVR
jgi:drug/metabolite transporter (DMT)-like permease